MGDETAEDRLEQFAKAMEAHDEDAIPEAYKTDTAGQFIADIREIIARAQVG